MRRALALALLCAACSSGPEGPGEGADFPPQRFARLEGAGVVSVGPGSGVIVVNVWATWCEPCRREMASLEKLHRRLGGEGVKVIGISVDEDRHLAAEFARRQHLSFENGVGDAGVMGSGPLAIRKFPTTFVIDTGGVIRWREEGARDWADTAAVERIRGLTRRGA